MANGKSHGAQGAAIKDHGVREEMSTGSRRDTQLGKPRPDLIPISSLVKLAMHYGNGAVKYGDRNWEKGQEITRYFASCFRHMMEWALGFTDEPHLIAAIWNLVGIDFTLDMIKHGQLPAELDDRPFIMQPDNPLGKELFDLIEENMKTLLENTLNIKVAEEDLGQKEA